jgi:hypothetical protein
MYLTAERGEKRPSCLNHIIFLEFNEQPEHQNKPPGSRGESTGFTCSDVEKHIRTCRNSQNEERRSPSLPRLYKAGDGRKWTADTD